MLWYHVLMATTRKVASKPSRNAAYQQRLKEHYRSFLITKDGRPYNPLLDEPQAEDRNSRGWSHGHFQGYNVAGCRCPLCGKANNDKQDVGYANRVAKLRAGSEAHMAALLATHRPDLGEADIRRAIDAVMQTAIVERLSGHKAMITFRPELVQLALQAAAGDAGIPPWDHTVLMILAGEFCGTTPGGR